MTHENGWSDLEAALEARGDAPFLRLDEHTFSGTATLQHTRHAAGRLADLELEDSEIVGVIAERSASCVLALLALWRRGLVAFVVNPGEPATARAELYRRAGCRLLLAPRAEPDSAVATLPWEELFSRSGASGIQLPARAARRLMGAATVVSTSGSGGRPKLAVHGLRQHLASAQAALAAVRLEPDHRWLLSLPLFHVGGLGILFRTAWAGAELAIPAAGARWEQAVVRARPTHLSVVATQLLRLLESDEASAVTPGLETVLAGGGPLSVGLRRAALDAGLPLIVSYGSTETASLITATAEPDLVARPGSAGRPLAGSNVTVSPTHEILVASDSLLTGYLGDDAVETLPLSGNKFATGDLGRVDETGCLFVDGRLDQMFISGGENVHPEEIEQAMLQIEGIAEVVVVPIPHDEYGARPAAFVNALPGTDVTHASVAQQLEQWLPKFKIPDHVWPMPEGSKKGLKPDRAHLRALAAAAVRDGR